MSSGPNSFISSNQRESASKVLELVISYIKITPNYIKNYKFKFNDKKLKIFIKYLPFK